MIRADARAIGAVTSTTTRVSERWHQSPNRRASECISYFNADKSDARVFRAASPDRAPRTTAPRTTKVSAGALYDARLALLGAIGDDIH